MAEQQRMWEAWPVHGNREEDALTFEAYKPEQVKHMAARQFRCSADAVRVSRHSLRECRRLAMVAATHLLRQGEGLEDVLEIVWHDEPVKSELANWLRDWNDTHAKHPLDCRCSFCRADQGKQERARFAERAGGPDEVGAKTA